MTHKLNSPLNEANCDKADWAEFKCIISPFNQFNISDFKDLVDDTIDDDLIDNDIAAHDAKIEVELDNLYNEINTRQKCMGDAYPFIWNNDNTILCLKSEIIPAGYVYLFCLFISHYKSEKILVVEPNITNRERDLFQVCSNIAAAGLINGSAYCLGWPRPIDKSLIAALHNAYGRMQEGKPVTVPSLAISTKEKDSGIDIIAWGHTNDSMPGRSYILGQVASGNDWLGKSAVNIIDRFHRLWLNPAPAMKPYCAIFIPFCIDENNHEIYKEKLSLHIASFGHFIYRYRLPFLVDKALKLKEMQPEIHYIDRSDELPHIIDFVENFITTLKA